MKLTQGSQRVHVDAADLSSLRAAGALFEDHRRERPRWFDGRFLAARDLIREQNYFLAREADLGRATGSGVATGLEVSPRREAHAISISAGHGITPSGELVLLERTLSVSLADIPRVEQLSGKFGLGRIPLAPMRSRSGLFALALRPVEFTANPVGAYPTSLTGQRAVEDGDIIEASALVLVPWPDDGGDDALQARRGRAARAIFVEQAEQHLAADLLPLAMLALDANRVVWIDAPMLRRELGADRDDLPGLGLTPRALRFAHVLQHQQHLAELAEAQGRRAFTAASAFAALPPAGPLPPGVISSTDFSQRYFPSEVDVELSVIPEDELPALVEESLMLPPIDLTAPAEDLETTSVLVLAAVPRSQWRAVLARLQTLTRPLRPAAPNRVAARKPLEVLQRLRLPQLALPAIDVGSASEREWQRLVGQGTLWFVRRRNLAYREDVTGTARRLAGRELDLSGDLRERLATLNLGTAFDGLLERATPSARTEIGNLLSSPRIAASPALTAVTIGELTRAETIDTPAVLTAESKLTESGAGSGLTRLDAAASRDPLVAERLSTAPDWRTIDREAATATRPELERIDTQLRRPVTPPTR